MFTALPASREAAARLALSLAAFVLAAPCGVGNAQSVVRLENEDGRYRLTRNGEPFFIHGAGGAVHLRELATAGANSIRTWEAENVGDVLDAAHAQGLTVTVGMWLGHERHGFDYQDADAVAKQLEACRAAVKRYKDHPAVLMWCVGNEMEGDGKNLAVWYAVNHIARECKRIDPDHPTMTVIAEVDATKVKAVEGLCPDIDIVGINSYGGIVTLAERYREAGGTKPYVVTEFGPLGPWEVSKTDWGAPIEPSSTEKAAHYAAGYDAAVTKQPGLCLGAYAFLWGEKQETTATWFGMLLPDGSKLGPVDEMSRNWKGQRPPNLCPEVTELRLDGPAELKPGDSVDAKLTASDPDGDPLAVRWVLREDPVFIGVGGDPQEGNPEVADAVRGDATIDDGVANARLTAPSYGGAYRLFAYVSDGKQGAAVANVPFKVNGPKRVVRPKRATLPLIVYGDETDKSPYAPSGYMGNVDAIRMTLDSPDQPRSGATCLKAEYTAGDGWGGVLWQSPANDWDAELPGGLDMTGATALEFWARGARGGEVVNFVFGVVKGPGPYADTAEASLNGTRLTTEWNRYRLPLKGADLSRIKTAFGWSLAGQGAPVTFYIDDIRFVAEP